MKKKRLFIRSIILTILLGALVYTLYMNLFTTKEKVAVGSQAPDFVLTNLEGKEIQFSELRGKGVFLNFWGTWCEPCKYEMPYIANQYSYYKGLGVEVLAVNVGESKLAVQNFVDQYGMNFPVLLDSKKQVLDAYGINPLPTTMLIDKNGEVVKIITGTMTERMVRDNMELIKP